MIPTLPTSSKHSKPVPMHGLETTAVLSAPAKSPTQKLTVGSRFPSPRTCVLPPFNSIPAPPMGFLGKSPLCLRPSIHCAEVIETAPSGVAPPLKKGWGEGRGVPSPQGRVPFPLLVPQHLPFATPPFLLQPLPPSSSFVSCMEPPVQSYCLFRRLHALMCLSASPDPDGHQAC